MRALLVALIVLVGAREARAQRSGAFWGRGAAPEAWEELRAEGMRALANARQGRLEVGLDPATEARREEKIYGPGAEALRSFEAALELRPDDADLHYAAYWVAQNYLPDLSRGRHLAVVAHVDALRRLRPIHADGLGLAVNYVEALGRLAWLSSGAEAGTLFARCADAYAPLLARMQEVSPGFESDTTYSNAAEVMMAAGRLDDALVYYRRSVAVGPTRALNHYGLAMALDRAGEGESALRSMREAIRLDTAHVLAAGDRADTGVYFVPRGDKLAYEALAAEAEGRRGDAVRKWREFLERAPDAQASYKTRARQHLKALGAR